MDSKQKEVAKVEIYKKTGDYFRHRLLKDPNMKDYGETKKSWDWEKIKKELPLFPGGKINTAHIAIDQHMTTFRKNKVALYWEDEDGTAKEFTFEQLYNYSNQFANLLKKLGVESGDRVFIFLPRIPKLFISFLGIEKTGAIAGTLFQAFEHQALLDRLQNSGAKILVTNHELKKRVDVIKKDLPNLEKIILVDGEKSEGHIVAYKDAQKESREFKPHEMSLDDPAFMLYTSGTTGKPKGVIHAHRAIIQEYITAKYVLDMHEEDTYFCTADPGWVTGIAYEILGSWANGAASLIYAGRFDADRWYEMIQKYRVTIWYTAPTAVRMLAKIGIPTVRKYNLSTLRHICSVGEPLNPEAIRWGIKAYGLPFHDNWWQTETGAIMIANYPSMDIKIGSMGRPFPGVEAGIVDDKGHPIPNGKEGNLAAKPGWPAQMLKIWRRPEKYKSYFEGGWYISGDRAWRDNDGYFWFMGRADDVIKTAGERVGPFEVESTLVEHPAVAEAGVIGKPDPERGEIIKAFCVLRPGHEASKKLEQDVALYVKKHLAGHAYPREVEFVDTLPKTRSGKIMRRILKAKELGLPIGDTSTLEEY